MTKRNLVNTVCPVLMLACLLPETCPASLTPEQIIAGLRQRETAIEDVSYSVTWKQFDGQSAEPTSQIIGKWKAKGNLWYYDYVMADGNGKPYRRVARAYDGNLCRTLLPIHGTDRNWGEVKREDTNRNDLTVHAEDFYITFNDKPLSSVLETSNIQDLTVEKTVSGDSKNLYWIKGNNKGLGIGILVDPSKGFYPMEIAVWIEERGHDLKHPTGRYYTKEFQQTNGIWMPKLAVYEGVAMSEDNQDHRIEVYFSDIEVNSGLKQADFVLQWPKNTKIHDLVLDEYYYSDMSDMVSDKGLAGMEGEPGQQISKAPKRQFFIPDVNTASQKGEAFILDLATGKLIDPNAQLGSEPAHKRLVELGKGDLAWSGSILTVRKAKALTIPQESRRPLTCTPHRFCNVDRLPDRVELPYSLLIIPNEDTDYLLTIHAITPAGITVTYRELSADEAKRYYN